MNSIQIPATGIGLIGCMVYPNVRVFRDLMIANSIAGLFYMHSEYEALNIHGSVILGTAFRVPTKTHNFAFNLVLHAIVPYFLSRRGTDTPISVAQSIGLYVMGLLLIDTNAVYPTQNGFRKYMQVHFTVFVLMHFI